MEQRTALQPVEQGVAIAGRQDFVQRIAALQVSCARACDREQMQVMIAEDDDEIVAQSVNATQRRERARTAIDDVTGEPQAVAIRPEADAVEQGAEFVVTALHVTDGVESHSAPSEALPAWRA